MWVMLGMFVGNDGPHAAAHNRDMAISLTFSLTGVLMLVLSWCPTVWMRRNWDAYICTAMLLLGLPFVLRWVWVGAARESICEPGAGAYLRAHASDNAVSLQLPVEDLQQRSGGWH